MTNKKTIVSGALLQQGGALLFRLQRQIGFDEKKEVECCGVTMQQSLALLAFGVQRSMLMGELSTVLNAGNSTATRLVDNMVRDGLLERAPDADDRRAVRVSLTPKGAETRQRLTRCYRQFWEKIFLCIPEGKRGEVVASLEILANALEQCSGSSGACC